MSKSQTKDLLQFLKPYPQQVQEITLWLRDFVWDLYPEANELLYDNYNAVVTGFSPSQNTSDVVCSVAVYSNYVNFGFMWGTKIADTDKILVGGGNQYRYITVKDKKDFPKAYMKKLLKEAFAYSTAKMKPGKEILKGATIVKSISPKKRRPK